VRIGARHIDQNQPPYIIAEIGVNHDGAVDRAIELANAAKKAGADAIKLQFFQAERLLGRAAALADYQRHAGAKDPVSMLRSLELTVDEMRGIVAAARTLGLHAIVTVFSVDLVAEAETLECDAYKTASPDIINRPLIQSLLQTGRSLIVSTGAASLDEVMEVTRQLGAHPHLLMQCVSSYPTPDECAALAGRAALCTVNPNALGYSDHTTAIDTGALAVASGARVLEKHLTYDHSAAGPDHAASLNPAGFAEYVRLAHRAFRMLGKPEKTPLDVERDVRQVARQSLTTTRDLKAGHVLTRKDLTIKRPGTGISPSRYHEIIGRRLRRPVEADMPIAEEHLA
jgi:N,N'-diacetyllegionaminate synthase